MDPRPIDADLLRTLIDSIPELAWTARPDGFIDFYNRRWYEYTGTTPDQMEGWGWKGVHHPDLIESVLDRWMRSLETGEPFEMEFKLRGADGAFRWFLTRVAPHKAPDGRIIRWFGTNTDIDALKKIREELAEERQQFSVILEEIPLGVIVRDGSGKVLLSNKASTEIFGGAGREPLGADALCEWNVQHIDGRAYEDQDAARKLREDGVPVRSQVSLVRRADGVDVVVRSNAVAIKNRDGKIGLIISSIEDVTDEHAIEGERRRALEALDLVAQIGSALSSSLDYEETLARVAQLAVPRLADTCSVYALSSEGRIDLVAAAGEEADSLRAVYREAPLGEDLPFGYPHVIRSGQTELMPELTDDLLECAARSPAHLAAMKKFGGRSWIIVPLRVQARTFGAIAFTRRSAARPYGPADVPIAEEIGKRASLAIDNARLFREAKSAYEAERRARDKAEDATRLKDEFLATLSHELRTPLNAILGWSRMMQSSDLPEEKRMRAIDTIARNAAAQAQLIEDLLDVSRIITGKLRLNVDSVDVNHVVEAALDVVRPAADAKEVRLQVVLDPDAGLFSGDAVRLQQVVWNLLTNAVKFTPKGGRVHVSLRRTASYIELSVADTGAGITAEFLPYVFDRFRQQDGTITRRSGGLGLGLAIVKNLVELHGGSAEAHSAGENKGATFVVRLPMAPVRSAPVQRPERVSRAPKSPLEITCPGELEGLKILVIDDEKDARYLIQSVLEHCHAVVTTAASAREALTLIPSLRPDVIVSDIGMPEEDGYSFIRKLRALPKEEGGRSPAVALTAYARPEDRTRALVEGFQSHAAKPVDPQELVIVVANLAGRFL